jgi:hypothetical protein
LIVSGASPYFSFENALLSQSNAPIDKADVVIRFVVQIFPFCCLIAVGGVKALTDSATTVRIIRRNDEVNIFNSLQRQCPNVIQLGRRGISKSAGSAPPSLLHYFYSSHFHRDFHVFQTNIAEGSRIVPTTTP